MCDRRWVRTPIHVAAFCLAAGCYNYAPLASPSPDPGTYLAVTLTDVGSRELIGYLGADVSVVRGRYVGTDDQGLLVSVSSVEVRRGWEVSWAGENVALPTGGIASLEVRHLSKRKTVLLAGVGVAGLVVTAGAFTLTGGGSFLGIGGKPGKN